MAINDQDPIGYEQVGEKWVPIVQPSKGYIYTAAVIFCRNCKDVISGMGGPRYNSVCLKCADVLNVKDHLK